MTRQTVSFNEALAYSRASTGTHTDANGVIQTAAIDEPRFNHELVNGVWVKKGILIEESRTNLLTYSEQFDNAAWDKVGITVAANAANAPDGTNTADKISEDSTDNSHEILQSFAATQGTTYSTFIYAKAAGRGVFNINYAGLILGVFDLSSGNATLEAGNTNTVPLGAYIVACENGWHLCSVVWRRDGSDIYGQIRFSLQDGTSASYLGDGTSGIYIWGAQLEQANSSSSYIKTEASTATRASDIISSKEPI